MHGVNVSVKHLNPRQGITTTNARHQCPSTGRVRSVKHLNPRQGITTVKRRRARASQQSGACETPKSPPGDYNQLPPKHCFRIFKRMECETPKSPPGDYNSFSIALPKLDRFRSSVKHLNPRQGITTQISVNLFLHRVRERVKHLNPRQGITTSQYSEYRSLFYTYV